MKDLITVFLSSILFFVLAGCYTQLEVSDVENRTAETLHNQNCQYERIYVQTEFGLVKRYQKVCRDRIPPYQSYFHNYHHRYHRLFKKEKQEKKYRPRDSMVGRSLSKKNARKRGRDRSKENKEKR